MSDPTSTASVVFILLTLTNLGTHITYNNLQVSPFL